jgi:hypothetical protein
MYHLKEAGEIYCRNICRIQTVIAKTVRKKGNGSKTSRKKDDALQYSTCYLVNNVPKAAGRAQVKRCPSHGYNLP